MHGQNVLARAASLLKAVQPLQQSLQMKPPLHPPHVSTRGLQRLYSSTTLYNPLQPSTTIQLYILYTLQPSTTPLRRQCGGRLCGPTANMELPSNTKTRLGCSHTTAFNAGPQRVRESLNPQKPSVQLLFGECRTSGSSHAFARVLLCLGDVTA